MSRALAFSLGGSALVLTFVVAGLGFLAADDVPEGGPLSRDQPELREALPGTVSLPEVLDACFPSRMPDSVVKVVGGEVGGRPYYACYAVSGDTDGSVEAVVVDGDGQDVADVDLIKSAGAWPWIGGVTGSLGVLLVGVLGAAAIGLVGVVRWLARASAGAGQPTKRSRRRTAGLVLASIGLGIAGLVAFVVVTSILLYPDAAGLAAVALVVAAFLYGALVEDVLRGRPLLSWIEVGSGGGRLALALGLCALLVPGLVLGSVLSAAFGELPLTDTLVTSLLVLAAGVALLSAVLVARRWRSERRASAAAARPSWLGPVALALALAGWVSAVAVAVGLAASRPIAWGLSTSPAQKSGVTEERSDEIPQEEQQEESEPPSAEELEAARLVASASRRPVRRAYCASGICDVVFASGTCQVWLVRWTAVPSAKADPMLIPGLACEESDVGPR